MRPSQVVNFVTGASISYKKWPQALAQKLPDDIVCKEARVVSSSFDSRRSAKARIYSYQILIGSYVPVRQSKYVWHIKNRLDIARMKKASRCLVGIHNFRSFCKEEEYNKTFLRNVLYIKISKNSLKDELDLSILTIDIKANSFLHNMVRAIVGTLADVGRGKITHRRVALILKSEDRKQAGFTAPAKGLSLKKVEY